MTKTSKVLFYGFLILLLIAIGFLRDHIFKQLNFALDYIASDGAYVHPIFSWRFLAQLSPNVLLTFKWVGTFLFMGVNWMASWYILKRAFPQDPAGKFLTWIYVGAFILAFFFYTGGYVLGNADLGYRLSRQFMGFLQSPLPLMIIFPILNLTYKRH